MEAVSASCLRDVWPLALQACVIGIDEGQFVSFLITPPTELFLSLLKTKTLKCCASQDFVSNGFPFKQWFTSCFF